MSALTFIQRPAEETTVQNISQIFPINTIHLRIPSAGGRSIPVKIIRFRTLDNIDKETNQEVFSNSVMAPRGFRDDFDMKSNRRRVELENRFEMHVPVVPENSKSNNWVPGELIVNEITRRQIKMLDHSQFGPIKSVTFIPSIRSGIVVFEKRYNPEKLIPALKFLYGIDSEPNGMITTT